jgi:tetratricopeptide (TPR) repeat protein
MRVPLANDRCARVSAALAALLLLVTPTAGVLAEGEQSAAPDQIELVKLTSIAPGPQAAPDAVRFEALVNYRLQSVPQGFALMFAFEGDQQTATQQTPASVPITGGSGQFTVDLDYQPHEGVQDLSLLVGMFKDESSLLSWVATKPFVLAPWQARADFDRAMSARRDGSYDQAFTYLSTAISLAPDIGNFYYWRGDTLVHLGQYDNAIADFSQALDMMPGHRPSLVGRGAARLWANDLDGAITDLSAVTDTDAPSDRWTASAFRARGLAHAGLDQRDQAIADYQAYLALTPDASDRDQVEGWIAALQ